MAGSPITGPNQQRGGTPGGYIQQQQQQQQAYANSPGALSFSDLQGLEFLQGVGDGGAGGAGGAMDGNGDGLSNLNMSLNPAEVVGQMDLGFGIGWEGNHHDFSDGQQLDLFEGFFFGGQQGGGGGGGGLGGGGGGGG